MMKVGNDRAAESKANAVPSRLRQVDAPPRTCNSNIEARLPKRARNNCLAAADVAFRPMKQKDNAALPQCIITITRPEEPEGAEGTANREYPSFQLV